MSSTPQPRARIRQKKSPQLSDSPLRPQSWGYNSTTSTTTNRSNQDASPTCSSSATTATCKSCLKPISYLTKANCHPRSQHQTPTAVCRSVSTTGFHANPFKRYQANTKSKTINDKQEFTTANLVKFNLNKLGTSMPNLYYNSVSEHVYFIFVFYFSTTKTTSLN